MHSLKRWLLIGLAVIMAGCLTPMPTISPLATPPTSPPAVLAPDAGHSLVSVHIGNRPDGLDDFLETAHPTILYSLNNSPMAEIIDHSPSTILIRRIQNDTWGRLPDCMYCGLFDADWEAQARASARWEIQGKLIYVPGRGYLNYIGFAKLSQQDYLAPLNEPVLGSDTGDHDEKARWLNAWYEEWLTIAHANGLRGSIYSFATGEPPFEAVEWLVGSARMAAEHGDLIDLHAYGIEGPLMDSPSSGAFWFVKFYNRLPPDARPLMVISEFSAGNGYDTGLRGQAWIDDALAYGQALRHYTHIVLGAAAFQSDRGAESHIPGDVLGSYARQAAAMDWSPVIAGRLIYLPLISLN